MKSTLSLKLMLVIAIARPIFAADISLYSIRIDAIATASGDSA